jgi:hypothetical protein
VQFDAYAAIDFSAASRPVVGADSCWLSMVRASRQQGAILTRNFRTRYAMREWLQEVASGLVRRGERLLVCADVALGYPTGFGSILGRALGEGDLSATQVLDALALLVEDGVSNRNNRFEAAALVNRLSGRALFWGRPRGLSGDLERWLPRSPGEPGPLLPNPLRAYRACEERLARLPSSVWRLYGTGAVGGQSLLFARFLWDLREGLGRDGVCIWPFADGDEGQVLVAECWPSLWVSRRAIASLPDPIQTRVVAETVAEMDRSGELREALAVGHRRPEARSEGWILGLSP